MSEEEKKSVDPNDMIVDVPWVREHFNKPVTTTDGVVVVSDEDRTAVVPNDITEKYTNLKKKRREGMDQMISDRKSGIDKTDP